jgi:hypothetical protein
MENENIENTENGQDRPSAYTPMNSVEKMRSLGIEPNEIVALFLPLIEQSKKQTLDAIDSIISSKTDEIANSLVAQLNKRSAAAGPPVAPPPAPAYYEQESEPQQAEIVNSRRGTGSVSPDMIAMLMKAFLNPAGNGAPSDGGLAQMATMAKSWGEVMKAVMEPVASMQAQMRSNLLQELSVYSKTGGKTPWEEGSIPDAPPESVANLNHNAPDKKKIAADLAARMKY